MSIRKIGGIYWLSIGRLRVSFCLVRRERPKVTELEAIRLPNIANGPNLGGNHA